MHDRYYIGSSSIPGIIGVSPYRTPLAEYHAIIGDNPEINAETRKFFDRRKSLEPYMRQVMVADLGLEILSANERYTDPEYDFIRSEIDAETTDENLEFKTVHPYAAKDWGSSDEAECPLHVTAQAMYGLMVRPKPIAKAVGMIGFDSTRVVTLARDEDLIATLRTAAVDFWHNHILPRVPPAPTTAGDVLMYVKAVPGAVLDITGSPEFEAIVDRYREANATRKAMEAAETAAKAQLQLLMQEHTAITCNGVPLLTWNEEGDNRLDQAALKAAHPDIYTAFYKNGTKRVLRLKKIK